MKVFGLIGHPLGHSFSKAWFTEEFQREGLDCRYENFDLETIGQVTELLKHHPEIMGCNVTSPYKEKILDYIDYYDAIVAETRSVNTLKRQANGRFAGFNTDVVGFSTLLQAALDASNPNGDLGTEARALILGTGGASKAVQYVMQKKGIPFALVSRDPRRGDFTYGTLGREDGKPVLSPEVIRRHRILVNATPLGTHPDIESAPDLPYDALSIEHLLIDLVYNPEETLFLRRGRERGAATFNGRIMLYAQAAASWEIWNVEQPTPKGSPTGGR